MVFLIIHISGSYIVGRCGFREAQTPKRKPTGLRATRLASWFWKPFGMIRHFPPGKSGVQN